MVVQFPVDKLISPSIFQVKVDVGQKVFFFHKGYLIEGIVQGYFGHITPDEAFSNLLGKEIMVAEEDNIGAKTAQVSQIGYAVAYFVPNPQPGFGSPRYIKQVQLLDESEFYLTKEELIDHFMASNYLKMPGDVDGKNFGRQYTPVTPV